MHKLYSIVARVLFGAAFVLLAVAICEAAVNAFGYTFLRGTYSKGRLVELGAVLLVFVITLLLRQMRDLLRGRTTN